MPVDNPHTIEMWLAGISAAIASVWKVISMFFNIKSDVESHGQRLDSLEEEMHGGFDALRIDIKDVGKKTEARHNRIEDKLDRLIERDLKG